MKLYQVRRGAYTTGKYLGDFQAIRKGKIGQRLVNRFAWKAFSQLMRSISRG